MKKQMNEVIVSTDEEEIVLMQNDVDNLNMVRISPYQVEALLVWLQEAKEELLEKKNA